ncbi:MAG: hypothetical protein DHS20C16_00780 [Phycisphaerae bacterium]|nr:MAG: hypothetical protein DHS20C16_00780 [Phycisphaerae bacterium]
MDERTRMFRVLSSLAVAMVGGGGMLFWLEPESGITITLTPAQYAHDAVAACPTLAQQWRGVTIVPIEPLSQSRTLTAVGQREDLHFLVMPDGAVVAQKLWVSQSNWGTQDRPSDPSIIRVGMHIQAEGGQIGSDQFEGLRALWTTLNDRIGHSGGAIPLNLKFAGADRYEGLGDSISADLLDSQDQAKG